MKKRLSVVAVLLVIASVCVIGCQKKEESSFEPSKIRIIKEAKYLEIYWDREVVDSEGIENYELKNGDKVFELHTIGASDMYFYHNGQGFTSFRYSGIVDESQPLTLEIKGEIKEKALEDPETAEKKVYDVSYENYYTQFYTSESGIVCQSSDDVEYESLKAAAEMIDIMLAKTDTGIPERLVENGAKMALYGSHENAYFIPEHRYSWDPNMYYVEGYGGSKSNNGVSSIAERNVTRNLTGEVQTAYRNENILVHEFGHCVKLLGMDELRDTTLRSEFLNLYGKCVREGLWPNTYAISNSDEFFATMCTIWFNVMEEVPDWSDGVRSPINTREELKEYDPDTYAFFEKIFSSDVTLPAPWDQGIPNQYHN